MSKAELSPDGGVEPAGSDKASKRPELNAADVRTALENELDCRQEVRGQRALEIAKEDRASVSRPVTSYLPAAREHAGTRARGKPSEQRQGFGSRRHEVTLPAAEARIRAMATSPIVCGTSAGRAVS